MAKPNITPNVARDLVDAIRDAYPQASTSWFGVDGRHATLYVQTEPGGEERVLVLDLELPELPFGELVDNVLKTLE